MAAFLSKYDVLNELPHSTPLEHPRDMPSISWWKTKTKNLSSSFRRRRKSASIGIESSSSSSVVADKNNYLTIEQFQNFLQSEQHMVTVSIEDCSKLIAKFEPSSEGHQYEEIGIDGLRLLLLHDEFCIMNADKSHRVYHDMTRPLTDYFIATSHNTYVY
jgi:hypothetical protein